MVCMLWLDEWESMRFYAYVLYSNAMVWDFNAMVWDFNVMLRDFKAMLCFGVCYAWTDCVFHIGSQIKKKC